MNDFDFVAVITDYRGVFHGLYVVDEGDVVTMIEVHLSD